MINVGWMEQSPQAADQDTLASQLFCRLFLIVLTLIHLSLVSFCYNLQKNPHLHAFHYEIKTRILRVWFFANFKDLL